MKNWKEVPHLFVGNFEIITSYLKGHLDKVEWHKESQRYLLYTHNRWFDVEGCKLIARPISDMSDDEIKSLYESYREGRYQEMINFGRTKNELRNAISQVKTFAYQELLYLLSIGCYPFNQDNPKDVI
ncbi:hypothetical protein, partial [Schnuerera sp.]|uniref:hypothetical protein n=1 Tax=Schnuerera sp. TaxID=2794844 RepID=UPI002C2195F7